MIKVNYQNKIWNLHREDNIFILIDVNNGSNILKIEKREFENLLYQNIIVYLDDYASQKQTGSLMYFDNEENHSEKIKTKIEIVKRYVNYGKEYNKKDFCMYAKKQLKIKWSLSTINRVITDFEKCGNNLSFLIPKKQVRKSRLNKNIQKIIMDCIQKEFANTHRKNIRNLYEKIKIALYKINIEEEDFPSYQTVCNYIHKYGYDLEIEKKRLGSKEYYKRYGAVFNGVKTTYPLERVEIDHTYLDIKVYVEDTDEYGNKRALFGRPVLTVIKDHYTKSFLGYYLAFYAPNTEISIRCLKHAMQRKFEKYSEIGEEWIQYGRIKEIVMDNGSEFKSKKFAEVCLNLGINLIYSSSYEPWLKGTVESAFNNLSTLLERLPSKIRKDIIVGQKVEETVISFQNLDFLLNLWIIKDYHNKYNERTKNTANNLWVNYFKDNKILDAEIENINFDLMDVETIYRKLSRKGIVINTVRYNSNELNDLFKRNKKFNALTIKAKININSDDVSYIYVFDEMYDKYLKVSNIDGIPVGFSSKDLKFRNKKQNILKHKINRIHDKKVNEVNQSINSIINKSKYDQKALRRKKISSDNTIIKSPKKPEVIDLDIQESIYADGGLFDVDD
ncbi:integrase catalytic domain-containing protein [Acinetobacter indicus]|uniref:integrase catalytic domain-containing protein n=1 Tax=Acinetobacter indicus TaxID=756892 RepID=UPI0025774DEA|nr:transposase family protein [Acinetobacter indicus]MDM1287057.1 transposase family protein [Acinetobacter indicus]